MGAKRTRCRSRSCTHTWGVHNKASNRHHAFCLCPLFSFQNQNQTQKPNTPALTHARTHLLSEHIKLNEILLNLQTHTKPNRRDVKR